MIDPSSSSFKSVSWSSEIGIFWTLGTYDLTDFDYLTTIQFDEISSKNLYEARFAARERGAGAGLLMGQWEGGGDFSFIFN